MDARMQGCKDGWMDGWIQGWIQGWMHGWMQGAREGGMDGFMYIGGYVWMDDGCMDGRVYLCLNFSLLKRNTHIYMYTHLHILYTYIRDTHEYRQIDRLIDR